MAAAHREHWFGVGENIAPGILLPRIGIEQDSCSLRWCGPDSRSDRAIGYKPIAPPRKCAGSKIFSDIALREFALGIEASDSFANNRLVVLKCVFGVPALESEPVDLRPSYASARSPFWSGSRVGRVAIGRGDDSGRSDVRLRAPMRPWQLNLPGRVWSLLATLR